MRTWQIVLLAIIAVYFVGVLAMAAYLRFGNWKLAFFWPLTVLWALFGNIQ